MNGSQPEAKPPLATAHSDGLPQGAGGQSPQAAGRGSFGSAVSSSTTALGVAANAANDARPREMSDKELGAVQRVSQNQLLTPEPETSSNSLPGLGQVDSGISSSSWDLFLLSRIQRGANALRHIGSGNGTGNWGEMTPSWSMRSHASEAGGRIETGSVGGLRAMTGFLGGVMRRRTSAADAQCRPVYRTHSMAVTKASRLKMLHDRSIETLFAGKPTSRPSRFEIQSLAGRAVTMELTCAPTHPEAAGRRSEVDAISGDSGESPTRSRGPAVTVAVEFATVEMVVREGSGSVDVPVRRLGDCTGRLFCRWEMVNVNMPDSLFSKLSCTSGEVEFFAEDTYASITVPIPFDPAWNAALIFKIRLVAASLYLDPPDGNPALGENPALNIFCLNNGSFPGQLHSTDPRLFLWAWNFAEQIRVKFPSEARWGILYSCFPALYYFLTQRMLADIINCVQKLGPGHEDDCKAFTLTFKAKQGNLFMVMGGAYVLLFLVLHLSTRWKRMLRLKGKGRRMLRTAMFATMLQLSHEARQEFDDGDVSKALDTQVDMAIEKVWVPMFELFSSALHLLAELVLCYVITSQIKDGIVTTILYVAPAVMTALAMYVSLHRREKSHHLQQKALLADDNWMAYVKMSSQCCPLVLAYRKGWTSTQKFAQLHERYKMNVNIAVDYTDETIWILRLGFAVVTASVVLSGGFAARRQDIDIGSFVVLVNSGRSFGRTLINVAGLAAEMVSGCAAVQKISFILNSETFRSARLKRGLQESEENSIGKSTTIRAEDVQFTYPIASKPFRLAVPPVRLSILSDHLVCFPAHADENKLGRQTLFKLLSGELLPDCGTISRPAHWKVVYIPSVPVLFDGTLMYNLTYGNSNVSKDLVWDTCRRIGMSSALLNQEDFDVGDNGESLRFGDRLCVSVARALLAGVDMLLVSSAIDACGEEAATRLLRFLKGYVHSRGLPGKELPHHLRHIKTVIYASKFPALMQESDLTVVEAGSKEHLSLSARREEPPLPEPAPRPGSPSPPDPESPKIPKPPDETAPAMPAALPDLPKNHPLALRLAARKRKQAGSVPCSPRDGALATSPGELDDSGENTQDRAASEAKPGRAAPRPLDMSHVDSSSPNYLDALQSDASKNITYMRPESRVRAPTSPVSPSSRTSVGSDRAFFAGRLRTRGLSMMWGGYDFETERPRLHEVAVTKSQRIKMLHHSSSRDVFEGDQPEWPARMHTKMSMAKSKSNASKRASPETAKKSWCWCCRRKASAVDGPAEKPKLVSMGTKTDLRKEEKAERTSIGEEFVDISEQEPTRLEVITNASIEELDPQLDSEDQFEGATVSVEFDILDTLVPEGQSCVMVPLRRIGNTRGTLSVKWKLDNGNIVSKYFKQLQPTRGVAEFKDGENLTCITLPVVHDPTWHIENFYVVSLVPNSFEYPDDMGIKPLIGENWNVRVICLNDENDVFPAGVVADELKPARLAWGFVRHNYTEIPSETKWGLLFASCPALHFWLMQRSVEMVVSCITATDDMLEEESRCVEVGSRLRELGVETSTTDLLVAFAAAQVVLTLVLYIFKRWMRRLRLGQKAMHMLRTNTYYTMLELTTEAKEDFDDGDIPKVLDTQAETAVKCVWLPFFDLWDNALQMFVKALLTLEVAWSFDTWLEKGIILGSTPLMLILAYIIVRPRLTPQTTRHRRALFTEDNWSAFVSMCETCSPAIVIYRQIFSKAETFKMLHQKYDKNTAAASDYSVETLWFVKWMVTLIYVAVLVISGLSAQRGMMSVASFIVLLNCVRGFGKSLIVLTGVFNTMIVGCAAVTKVADILNAETRKQARYRRISTRANLIERSISAPESASIDLEDLCYCYYGGQDISMAVSMVSASLPAAKLVCIDGHRMTGMQTLFKLITGDLMPTYGEVRRNRRWRVIYVPMVPILFDGTLMYNLTYSDRAGPDEEVWAVCKDLGMSEYLLGQANFDVGSNGDSLQHSDKFIVAVARALLHDVDLLLISRAIDVLGQERGCQLLRYLRRYIKNRGVPRSMSSVLPPGLRTPKTVLYATKFQVLQAEAEAIAKPIGASPRQADRSKPRRNSSKKLSGEAPAPATQNGGSKSLKATLSKVVRQSPRLWKPSSEDTATKPAPAPSRKRAPLPLSPRTRLPPFLPEEQDLAASPDPASLLCSPKRGAAARDDEIESLPGMLM
eukprot:TRINITY_DN36354_c0_g1_i1.p1 TRINITY_DN36354_c0_g1~~TRINITY_DN36354_c0_g1_i1.p1  ORF type:complete len:2178 (-),score=408.68 TRINITY_DN36354_c0_g1_i1:204-6737(-)